MTARVAMRAKCTNCGRVYDMTAELLKDAREFGGAMSPCCMAVAIVTRVDVQTVKQLPKRLPKQ